MEEACRVWRSERDLVESELGQALQRGSARRCSRPPELPFRLWWAQEAP